MSLQKGEAKLLIERNGSSIECMHEQKARGRVFGCCKCSLAGFSALPFPSSAHVARTRVARHRVDGPPAQNWGRASSQLEQKVERYECCRISCRRVACRGSRRWRRLADRGRRQSSATGYYGHCHRRRDSKGRLPGHDPEGGDHVQSRRFRSEQPGRNGEGKPSRRQGPDRSRLSPPFVPAARNLPRTTPSARPQQHGTPI